MRAMSTAVSSVPPEQREIEQAQKEVEAYFEELNTLAEERDRILAEYALALDQACIDRLRQSVTTLSSQ